jgi:two-component SAPR family response regulator
MSEMREELSIEDLASITKALRILKPKSKDLICVGVEMPQPNDLNVVFHVSEKNHEGKREENIIMISAEIILERFGGTGNVAERHGY